MDIKDIKKLVDLMVENDLSRVELREGETHILLRRGQPMVAVPAPSEVPVAMAAPPPPVAAPTAADAAAGPTAPAEPAAPAAEGAEIQINSPMVGTFYVAPDPESPAFVKVGDHVGPETVVCLVEAMKVFNEIKAEVSGRITKVLVKNSEAVEFDQPLFEVAPA